MQIVSLPDVPSMSADDATETASLCDAVWCRHPSGVLATPLRGKIILLFGE